MPANYTELEKGVSEVADQLRGNSSLKSSEYSVPVLGLIFLRYGDFKFGQVEKELAGRTTRRRRQLKAHDDRARGALFVGEEARFDRLLNLPEPADLGKELLGISMGLIKKFLPLLLLLGLTGCDRDTNANAQNSQQLVAGGGRIATQTLLPETIRINIAELPEPYHTRSASQFPKIADIPPSPTLKVPAGFTVNVFADNLDRPRWLALTPSGDVLVTETRENRIRLLGDRDGDGVAEVRKTFATGDNGLNLPFGMAFVDNETDNYFFLGNTNEVRRFPYEKGGEEITGIGEKIADLPGQGYNQHWTRNVVVSPDGKKLYVSVGSASNVREERLPRASVQIMNLDGSQQQTFAYGLRNPVGLDFHPETGELYTTVNERDGLGDDLVPDYFTRIRQGEFYGWPYAYFKPNLLDPRQIQNGGSKKPDLAAKTLMPDVLFQSHSAALGLQFYDGNSFPEKYRNGAFVAFRGSWNRNAGTGYKIVFVPFKKTGNEAGRPLGYYEDFLTGFLLEPSVPRTWGRPVGVLVLPDGSLLFTEEANGRIYRVQYN